MMEPFSCLEAVAAPLPITNVDTDQIIPARYLARARSEGFGDVLFHDLDSPTRAIQEPTLC